MCSFSIELYITHTLIYSSIIKLYNIERITLFNEKSLHYWNRLVFVFDPKPVNFGAPKFRLLGKYIAYDTLWFMFVNLSTNSVVKT